MPGISVVGVVKRTVQRFLAKDTLTMGAALAYYTIFSLAPMVLIAVWLGGLFFGEEAAQGRVASEIEHAVGPTVAASIQEIVKNAKQSQGNAAPLIGIALLLFGAGGVFGQLQGSLNAIWEVPPKKGGSIWRMIRGRFLSFAMVLGVGFLLLVSLVVTTAITALNKYLLPDQAVLAQVFNQIVSYLLISVLFAMIYRMLPDREIAWQDVGVGAAFTALLFSGGKYLIGLYLAHGSVSSAYGAAGSLVVVLVWVYYASQILLFGAQFTQVYALERRGAPPPVSPEPPVETN